ncbi:porin [Planctomycetes bacterium K23_9]
MGPSCGAQPSCGVPSCGCELGVGCGSAFGGGCGGGCPLSCGSCNLGDPLSLFGETCGLSAGGWVSIGYHSKNLPLFNSHADRVNVHQAWLYAEKEADGSNGLGLGGRIDYVYGVDAQDTQSFGIANNHWDNDWDHGIYGSALPQLYMEAAYGNLSVKAGHFFTIIGWEVVTAPDNFFYSHAYTMYNSEPFTHTGVLATLTASEDLTFYGGYTLGWDSGFEDNGDSFLGGVSVSLTDKLSLTYASTGGRFADSPNGTLEKGYMHSLVADLAVTDSLQYIMQSDLLDTENNAGETVRDTIGLNNYLIYSVNDCLSLGARYEWWNVSADSQGFYGDAAPAGLANVATGDFDVTALTLGLNYKPHANVIVRPEIRWDWIDGDMNALALADNTILEDADDSQTTFGIDTIFTF